MTTTQRAYLHCASFALICDDRRGALLYLNNALSGSGDWRYRRLILRAIAALSAS